MTKWKINFQLMDAERISNSKVDGTMTTSMELAARGVGCRGRGTNNAVLWAAHNCMLWAHLLFRKSNLPTQFHRRPGIQLDLIKNYSKLALKRNWPRGKHFSAQRNSSTRSEVWYTGTLKQRICAVKFSQTPILICHHQTNNHAFLLLNFSLVLLPRTWILDSEASTGPQVYHAMKYEG